MNKRIEIGTLFFLFGLALLSSEGGQVQIGTISYYVSPIFLKGFAIFAFVVSGLYCVSLLLWLTVRSWLTRCENLVLSHFPQSLTYPALAIYFGALFIVFTQGLIIGVAKIPLEKLRLPLLVFGLIWIAFIAVDHVIQSYKLGKSVRLSRAVISGRNEWLGTIVDNEMKLRKPPVSFFTRLGLKNPGWKTVGVIVCIFGVSILLSWVISILVPGTFLISDSILKDYYLVMWQVQGAIAAFALPLLIVVIEFSKDQRHVAGKRPEALIRESWIFPIITYALLGTVRLGIDISWFGKELVFAIDFVFVLMGTICFTLIAYTRMLSILLSTQKMNQHSLALIKDLMASQLDKTIRQRIANNILLRSLKELGLDVFSGMQQEDKEIILRYHNAGIFYDINIGKLASFMKGLPHKDFHARESSGSAESALERVQKPPARKYPRPSWTKHYGQAITPKDNSLIILGKADYEISDTEDLEAQLADIIRVKQEKDKTEDVKELIGHIRDGLMDSIRERKIGAVKEGLEIYEELISTFLEKLQQWDASYKRDTAIREIHSLGGGWGEIMWIRDDLHEIIDMAIHTEHIGVLQEVLYFPFKVAIKAIQSKDYYVFQQFLDWIPYYYTMISGVEDVRAREFIISRCSMHLSEMLRYYTCPKLERSKEEGEIENNKHFTLGIIFIFNELLKIAYDNREIEHFRGFSATLNSAFEFLFRHGLDGEVLSLEYQLKHQGLSHMQKAEIEQELNLDRKRISVVDTIRETIEIMFYGLKAWMLHEYIDITDKIAPEEYQRWDEVIPSPTNLQESWKRFCSATRATHDGFDWSHWEWKEQERGAAYAGIMVFSGGGFDNYLRMLFCAQCLKVIARMSEEDKRSARMPYSHDTIFLAENESSPLKQLLNKVAQDKDKWRAVIDEGGLKVIPAFKGMLDKGVQQQRGEENELIRAADISAQKIAIVKQEIIDSWNKNAEFRGIVCRHGNYEFTGVNPGIKTLYGFNQLQSKDIYVEGSNVGIQGWGAHLGLDLASSEDERFIETLLGNLGESKGEKDAVQNVAALLSELVQAKYDPIVVILNSWESYAALEKSESFKEEENQSGHGLVGHFQKKPVYNLYHRGKPHIIVADLKKFCVWRQYKPLQVFDGEEYLSDELTFLVKQFTEESARDAIKKNNKWLLDKQGNPRSEAEVISELQLEVHFRLLEQFELEIKDKDSGYKLPI